jgi:uroporphyrinogen-III synthase
VVAAIGPTCQAAIEAFGVTPKIVPNPPKMGPLISSLATYFST